MSGRASSMPSTFFVFNRQKLSSLQSGCAARGSIETAMHQRMASSSQGDQVLLGIITTLAA